VPDRDGSMECSNMSNSINTDSCITTAQNSDLKVSDGNVIVENGDVVIDNHSVLELLKKIEERLALLTPNPELESDWEELKNLGNQYRELEKKILEKEKTWQLLKK